VRFTARAGGADFDGLRVTYVAGVTAGNERATYTAPAAGTPASLTIALEPGVSTPTQVAAAVTNLRPFTAAPKAPDATNGVVVDVTAPTEVTKDGRTGVASAGALGAILFTATRTGPQFNNLRVAYVDGAEQGKERATYDPATNTLTVQIAAGVSSADQVIVAVNAMAAPGYTAAAVASTTTVTTGVVAAAAVTPGVGAPAFGLLGAVKFTAVRDGAALDGLRVVYVDATTAGAERASYDPDTKTLRVAIEDGRTTPAQVVAALTAQPAFTATLVPAAPDAPVNVGGPTVVTRGGDLGTAAVGDLAGVRFTATRNGAQFNGLRVEFVGGATRGGERATYDAGTHLLRVTLEDGQSRASDVRAAVNRLAAPTADYTAAVVDLTAALGVGTTPTVTFGGAVAANASGVAGSLRFTARQPGAAFDNLTVTYVGGVTAGNERAHYDPATRVLSVVIEDGRTIPGQVAAAITDQRPFVATLGGPGAAVSTMPAPAALTQVTAGAFDAAFVGEREVVAGTTVRVTASRNGAAFNGLAIQYVGGVAAGNEQATWDPVANRLTVRIESGVTTAQQVVDAINRLPSPAYGAALADVTVTVAIRNGAVPTAGGAGALSTGILGGAGGTLRFTAVRTGADLNALTVEFVNTVTAGNERAGYEAATNRLTLAVASGVSTLNQVVTALANVRPFTASLAGPNVTVVAGGGPSGAVTAGGGATTASTGVLGSVRFSANRTGTAFDGLTVEYVDSVTVGNETASYDAATNRITVQIQSGVTTASHVAAAINAMALPPFTATVVGGDTVPALNRAAVTAGGGVAAPASGLVESIRYTAARNGADLDGLRVIYRLARFAGRESVEYDAVAKTLTVNLQTGVTRVEEVVAAVNRTYDFTTRGLDAGRIVFAASFVLEPDGRPSLDPANVHATTVYAVVAPPSGVKGAQLNRVLTSANTNDTLGARGTWTFVDNGPVTLEIQDDAPTPLGLNPGGQWGLHLAFVADPGNPNVFLIAGDTNVATPGFEHTLQLDGRIFRVDTTAGTTTEVVGRQATGSFQPTGRAAALPDADAFTLDPQAGGALAANGRYYYRITYVNADGREMVASDRIRVDLGGGNQTVRITAPTGFPAGSNVVAWKVYRTWNVGVTPAAFPGGAGLDALPDGEYHLVAERRVADGASVDDAMSDAALLTEPILWDRLQNAPADLLPNTTATAANLGGALAAGTYRYRISFVAADGQVSSPSPEFSVVVGGADDAVVLTNLPEGPAGTVGRIIWRTKLNGR